MWRYFQLIRIQQWIKNTFLFIPLFFAGKIYQLSFYPDLILGFLSFSLVASSIYIINDLKDINEDKLHPKKRLRPLASGKIPKSSAYLTLSIFLILGVTIGYLVNKPFTEILILYFVLNLLYSLKLKEKAVIDILIVALGFNLRVLAGGYLSSTPVTEWLMVLIFLLALFIAIAKRRDDLVIVQNIGQHIRKASKNYNIIYLNTILVMVTSVTLVAYLMYTLSADTMERFHTSNLYLTSFFVVAGLLRYLQITLVFNDSGSPTKILYRDFYLKLVIIMWILSFYFIIYFPDFTNFSILK
jgi:4-hydroxybenzoate polyprenyltransferase